MSYQPPADQWLRDLYDPNADDHHPGTATQEAHRRQANHTEAIGAVLPAAAEIERAANTEERMLKRMLGMLYPPIIARVLRVPAGQQQRYTIGDGIEPFVFDLAQLVPVAATPASSITLVIQGLESETFWLTTALPSLPLGIYDFREKIITITNNDVTNDAGLLVKWRRLLSTER
jgi:hypothetical protein